MLTYDIEKRGKTPIYEYLYQCIKNDILTKHIACGEKLPSKRSLARFLNISVITVENAYIQLETEGYIESKPRIGFFVCPISLPSEVMKKHEISDEITESAATVNQNKSNAEMFPFSVWAKIMRRVLTNTEYSILDPLPYNGIYKLRKAIADYLFHFRGMDVSPSQVIIGAGTEYLYSLIIQLLGRDKIYAVENPGYRKISGIYKNNDVDVSYIDIDKEGLSINKLKKSNASVVHISPSHHFPTGIVMPISRRYDILGWAEKSPDRYIIEDDYDSEFRFSGRPIPTMQSIDKNDRVIFINTFSKSLAPTIRVSYMVLPKSLCSVYKERLGFYSCTVSLFMQETLAEFISHGYFEKHINRMKTFYRLRRKKIMDIILSSPQKDKITIFEKSSGLHFLAKIDTAMTDSELKAAAQKKGLNITCLSDYYHDNIQDLHTVVVNYASADEDMLKFDFFA